MWINRLPAVPSEVCFAGHKDVKGARRLAASDRIHHDDGLKPLHQLQYKVYAADAGVHDLDMRGENACCQPFDDFDAEAVIAQQDIPEAYD
jgi:hypothetical protein